MSNYATGFSQGESDAWRGRNDPLPKLSPPRSDWERGYNDARLPRSHAWAIRTRVAQSWWDEARDRHVEAA